MRHHFFIVLLFCCYLSGLSQKTIEKTLERFNTGAIPYITIDELNDNPNVILLDTRKKEEFDISHLENAHWAGFKEFDVTKVQKDVPDLSTLIVVYCSIGVRSEQIGEKLSKIGYTNVKNLYGGIFKWKNEGYQVVDSLNNPTEKIHAFSKHWGKLLTKGDKIYTSKKK